MPRAKKPAAEPDPLHWALVVWTGWETDTTTVLHVAQLWAREHNNEVMF